VYVIEGESEKGLKGYITTHPVPWVPIAKLPLVIVENLNEGIEIVSGIQGFVVNVPKGFTSALAYILAHGERFTIVCI
jgi:hypothetical protein